MKRPPNPLDEPINFGGRVPVDRWGPEQWAGMLCLAAGEQIPPDIAADLTAAGAAGGSPDGVLALTDAGDALVWLWGAHVAAGRRPTTFVVPASLKIRLGQAARR